MIRTVNIDRAQNGYVVNIYENSVDGYGQSNKKYVFAKWADAEKFISDNTFED